MVPGQRRWDYDAVVDLFDARDKNLILQIPLSTRRDKDVWYSMAYPHGLYTIRSCYIVLLPQHLVFGGNFGTWRCLIRWIIFFEELQWMCYQQTIILFEKALRGKSAIEESFAILIGFLWQHDVHVWLEVLVQGMLKWIVFRFLKLSQRTILVLMVMA